jgi:hypothetical protein
MEKDTAERPAERRLRHYRRHLGIEPLLELSLQTLEHLLFDVFDVSELAPTSDIRVISGTLNLYDKLFQQLQLVRVFFPEMLFAHVRSLFLPVLGPQTHRRFKLAVLNDCRDVSQLFRVQAYIAANIFQDTSAWQLAAAS